MLQRLFPILPILAWLLSSVSSLLHGRDINARLLDSYDYIVVGCGISGLVASNRLSEDSSVTVLCIEAGVASVSPCYYLIAWANQFSDQDEAIIQIPVYVGADIGGIYDWNLLTVPQLQLDGGTRPMPQGKVLGGGSILNAMCWNRGGQDDYNTWEALGNPGWGWDGMLPYFMKVSTCIKFSSISLTKTRHQSETYTPVYSEEIAERYSINYNPAVHGFAGPVQVSYPKYIYPQSSKISSIPIESPLRLITVNLFDALNYLGIPTEFDQAEGNTAGAAFVPTDLDPNNQTRSDARRAYFDPYATRENFHVITGQHVTNILFEGVSTNREVSNPIPGDNSNGNGAALGNTGGLGFGPGPTIPPTDEETSSRFVRRDPASSSLRIIGVEVCFWKMSSVSKVDLF